MDATIVVLRRYILPLEKSDEFKEDLIFMVSLCTLTPVRAK